MRNKLTIAASLALLLGTASVARADDDPGVKGSLATRSQRFTINVDGTTAGIEVILPAAASFARPVVLICHGWMWWTGSYEGIAEHLASRGFACVLFQQPNRFSTSTPSWAKRLGDGITELGRLNASPQSGIFGELDMNRVSLMGHSYGGAAVTMLAGQDPRVKCVVALAPVNQYHYYDILKVIEKSTAPYLVLGGSSDPLCPGLYTRGFFGAAKRAAVRQIVEVRGTGHFFTFIGGGETAYLTARYYTAWLERFLMGKADPGQWTTGGKAKAQLQQGILSHTEHAQTGNVAPLPPPPPPPAATLQVGSTGQEVSALQTKLKALGFDPGAVDGDFGPATEKAVKAFQSSKGLTADGVVGPKTRAALGL